MVLCGTDKSLCNKIGVCTEGETTFSATAKWEHCLLNCDGPGVIDGEEHLLKDTYTSGILETEVGVQPTLRTDDTACEIGPKGVLCCGIFGRTRVLDGEQHFSTDSSNFLPRIKDGVDTVGEPIFLTVDALYGTMTLPRAGVLWPLTFDTTNGEGTFGEYRPTFLRGGVQKAPAGVSELFIALFLFLTLSGQSHL